MGLPQLNITFADAAKRTVITTNRGTVALIVRDSAESVTGSVLNIKSAASIPEALSAENKAYIRTAFLGNVYAPRCVFAAVIGTESDIKDALALLGTVKFTWLAAPSGCTSTEAETIKEWITNRRAEGDVCKAVLPNCAADSEAVVNFTASGITVGSTVKTTAEYCARVAGYLAGTPLSQSVTYGVLPEVSDITRLLKSAAEAAVDAGQLILIHDGEKVKFASGVTSLTTANTATAQRMKKIKTVEAMDAIRSELRLLVQDNYIGKYANSYDNKRLLITAVLSYFRSLETEGVLAEGSTAEIDVEAQRKYLTSHGIDTTDMTEDDIKSANTGSHVFIAASISIYDAIEDIDINIAVDLGV